MAVITEIAALPGRGSKRPALFGGSRTLVMRSYTFDFDASYPTGGEDITAVFNDFQEVIAVIPVMPAYTAATGKELRVDHTNKKLMLFDNAAAPAQVANLSDQSTITGVKLLVIGY